MPISALVPTRDRKDALARMLHSLAQQSAQPVEMVVVDASVSEETERLCSEGVPGLDTCIIYRRAVKAGAAAQRNQAMSYASQRMVILFDDDITFEPDCLLNLWKALEINTSLGGVNAMISNQKYVSPGLLSRSLFRVLHGKPETSYAGKCIGPALNLLPEDRPELPEIVPVEWLNAGCTLYRREALPYPLFPPNFTGYSFLEDLALSLRVGKSWGLANVRTARIVHESWPAEYKSDQSVLAEMELRNRHYVMTEVLGRRRLVDYLKLSLLEVFGVVTPLTKPGAWKSLPAVLAGKLRASRGIISA